MRGAIASFPSTFEDNSCLEKITAMLNHFIQTIEPWLFPLRFLISGTLIFLVGATLWNAIGDAVARGKEMHRIPCSNCQFFTNDYRLKCTINPSIANTQEAVNCIDYNPR